MRDMVKKFPRTYLVMLISRVKGKIVVDSEGLEVGAVEDFKVEDDWRVTHIIVVSGKISKKRYEIPVFKVKSVGDYIILTDSIQSIISGSTSQP